MAGRLGLLGLLLASTAAVWAADPAYYQRRGSWQESLRASRDALADYERTEAERPLPPGVPRLGPWYVAGPFVAPTGQTSYGAVFPPEAGVDLKATYQPGKLAWTAQPGWLDGVVIPLKAPSQAATFVYRTVTVTAETKLRVYLGSDDGLAVFLNGRKVHGNDVPRGCGPNQDQVELALRAGENALLLKICNIGGDHAFYFSCSPTPGSRGENAREVLWRLAQRDFGAARREMEWEREDRIWEADWKPGDLTALAQRYAAAVRVPDLRQQAGGLAGGVRDEAGLTAVRALYHRGRAVDAGLLALKDFDLEAVRLAVQDLIQTHGARYPGGPGYLERLTGLSRQREEVLARLAKADAGVAEPAVALGHQLVALRREALLANPALDFQRVLAIRRRGNLGLPANWQGNSSIGPRGYDNELISFGLQSAEAPAERVYRPDDARFVGDLDLHWNADRLLFSMPDTRNHWQVWELPLGGAGKPVQVTSSEPGDIYNFDGCYLPDGRVVYCSTACYQGVPCVAGSDKVSLLYLLDRTTGKVRQLTFDQDHSWDPSVTPDGRVLYQRWEYSDTPHYFTRLLFTMNPDGTNQTAFYGSNSYWPNSVFYARSLPGEARRLVGVVTGHHGERREGELVVFDSGRGRAENRGAVQRIPGRGKPVAAPIVDQLVAQSWPRFLHPCPVDDKHFLVACRLNPQARWGIYLVDTFDNFVLLREEADADLVEPVALRRRVTPPVVVDKVKPDSKEGLVYLADIYSGDGLAGVPRGAVQSLRVYSPYYAYPNMGGHIHIGVDGPWDGRRILGTVPVQPDGSALFKVPANTPIAVQPLDAGGRALQVMRSWMTAMPGETLSCVGCHEPVNDGAPNRRTVAARGKPTEITPWYGGTRGFSFKREVQPVLDRYCVGCHDGSAGRPDFRLHPDSAGWRRFTPSYLALHPFVRRPGPESDYHLPVPTEFGADTSELVQMLTKGHHGVQLDRESWDRLTTWIDLNVPCHGTWHEQAPIPNRGNERRRELRALFCGLEDDPEVEAPVAKLAAAPLPRLPEPAAAPTPTVTGWPCEAAAAKQRQEAGGEARRRMDLGGGQTLELVRVPAGAFVLGDANGPPDERPAHAATVERSYWMAVTETTNAQYAQFDPDHDSGYISETNKDQTRRGQPVNEPQQPVVRVSAERAEAFCRWLSARCGQTVSLPTEPQWEYACRAGTATPHWWGGGEVGFAPFGNLADRSLAGLCRADSPKWTPRDDRQDDHATVTCAVGRYAANAWGLRDMLGNAAEWTRSAYRPYPYQAADGRERPGATERVVVRGGSFYSRASRARSASRWGYERWRRVFDVGFRVVIEDQGVAR